MSKIARFNIAKLANLQLACVFFIKDGKNVKICIYNYVIYYISISYINIIQYFSYSSTLTVKKVNAICKFAS